MNMISHAINYGYIKTSQSVSSIINQIYTKFSKTINIGSKILKDVPIAQDLNPKELCNVVIIGSGPAALTAAIYAARADLNPIVYEGSLNIDSIPGGQLMTTTKVENYPGFPHGINGWELIDSMRNQAISAGAKMLGEKVTRADLSKRPFSIFGEKTHYTALAVIIATGATAKRLDIPGTRDGEFWQKGVSACAVCDGPLPMFRNKPIVVIGGGDSAMEEALHLSKYASKVSIVHRRETLRASQAMQKAALANPKIEIIRNSIITKVNGTQSVENVEVENIATKEKATFSAAGVFFAVGHTPNTAFLNGQLKLDVDGYIQSSTHSSKTSIPYVFAAGDVKDRIYRQAITAAGSGCMAALDAERAISSL